MFAQTTLGYIRMSKINVLEFSNQWSLGGTEKSAQLFMKYLDKDKFNVWAAGWRGGPRVELIKEYVQEVFINEDIKEMQTWMALHDFDIVHFHRAGNTESILIDTFKLAGIPVLVEHNIFGQFDSSGDNDEIDRHIFVSNIQKKLYSQRAGDGYVESKCIALYNPVEVVEFAKSDKIDYSKPIFGRHSRDDQYKWHPVNIQILPYVKAAVPDAKFHVIGLPTPYREAIERMGLMDMVVEFHMTPDESKIKEFLSTLTVYTHGSLIGESFGIGIAEAMSIGLPVVTHLGGDSAQGELVVDNFTGYVTKENDVKEYADRVIELLKNPTKKEIMGKNGQERALKYFEASQVTKQLEEIFTETLNGKKDYN